MTSMNEIIKIDDDMLRNEALYNYFDEHRRLSGRVGNVEYITVMNNIRRILKPGDRILDVGAGTGVYSIPLAIDGYDVMAYEPSEKNYELLSERIASECKGCNIATERASSFDMRKLPDKSFDVVLLFGPLYHLSDEDDRFFALMEARRVCKDGGHILAAFINHDMVFMTETAYNPDWFAQCYGYDVEAMRLTNKPFIFFTLDEARKMLKDAGLKIERTVASDGFAELMGDKINKMSDTAYDRYLKWHALMCEREEFLGASNHFLFVCSQEHSIKTSYAYDEDVKFEIAEISSEPVNFKGFFDAEDLFDGVVMLKVDELKEAAPERKWVPAYVFSVYVGDEKIGFADLRIGYSEGLYYGGNIGYTIYEQYRCKGYATRVCGLLLKLAEKHGMKRVLISNEINNIASRRVCEKLGARHLRTVLLPKDNDMRISCNQYIENIFEIGAKVLF